MLGRVCKRSKKKTSFACRKEGARSAGTCLRVDGVETEEMKWNAIG